jgi:hypothetical protein
MGALKISIPTLKGVFRQLSDDTLDSICADLKRMGAAKNSDGYAIMAICDNILLSREMEEMDDLTRADVDDESDYTYEGAMKQTYPAGTK